MFTEYLLREHKQTIIDIISSRDTSKHHPINVEFLKLFDADPSLATLLLQDPEEALKICDKQLLQVQNELQSELSTIQTSCNSNVSSFNDNECNMGNVIIHVRIHKLPAGPEFNSHKFPHNNDIPYMQLSGIVTRISAVKLLEYKRDYVCKKCRQTETVTASYIRKYVIEPPTRCSVEGCNGINMVQEDKMQPGYCKDYQEIKIQEDATLLGPGALPNTLWITLEDDLADICKPGDSVRICGQIMIRWGPLVRGKKIDVSLALRANHVTVDNDRSPSIVVSYETQKKFDNFWLAHRGRELAGRDKILRSFSPQIYGMYMVKLAVAVVLAGGTKLEGATDENASRIRTQPHLLLVGDPGTGKSQLLRFATQVIPRSVMTTGIGSTSAGLTVTAIMENGEWQLEAGALVLSDGGICCIDEFSSMREHDRMSIHEAMEQQSINVAKAGIVCKLNTRCSILAAANPKGQLNINQPLSCNIAIASPLLSRFDLILLIKDRINEDWDSHVAKCILRGCRLVNREPEPQEDNETWSLAELQAYYTEIRKRNPTLIPQTRKILSAYYQFQRKRLCRDQARTTVRLLDSLIRLSQAHAKLMYHDEVQVLDAVMAIAMVEASMDGDAAAAGCNEQVDFFDDPDEHYRRFTASILKKLNVDLTETDFDSNLNAATTHLDGNNDLVSPTIARVNDISEENDEEDIEMVQSPDSAGFTLSAVLEPNVSQDVEEQTDEESHVEATQMDKPPDVAIQKENVIGVAGSSKVTCLKERFGFLARETSTEPINNVMGEISQNKAFKGPFEEERPLEPVSQLEATEWKVYNTSIFEEDILDDDLFDP